MANLFDYLAWRGDLPLEKIPFCELDAMILARLSYLPLEVIVSADMAQTITIREASDRIAVKEASEYLWKGDDRLIGMLGESERFRHLKLSGFVNRIDEKKTMQFCALIIELAEDLRFLSFRGTDNTLVGWQEDFNLFYEFPVPSQEEALRYFEAVYAQLGGEWLLGGHSKGGNLAVYAAVQASPKIQSRIDIVWSNDGPGFQEAFLRSEAYQALSPKIRSIVPKSSVVGMLLAHPENYQIVDSSQIGLLQHDGLSWQIMGDHFIILPELTHESIRTERTIRSWLQKIPQEEREEFVDSLFSVLYSTGAHTLSEIRKDRMKAAAASIPALKELPKENRDRILEFVMLLNLISKRLNDESKAVRTERILDKVPAFSQRSKKRKKSRATIPLSTET